MTARTCEACKGKGYDTVGTCITCDGTWLVAPPEEGRIRSQIIGRRGLRSKRPADPRAYFVWRLARFHGGADARLPVAAYTDVWGDPFVGELEEIAERVAREVFGGDLRGAARWAKAGLL